MAFFCRLRNRGLYGELREHDACQWLHGQLAQLPDIVSAGQVLKRDPAHSVRVIESCEGSGPALLCKFFPTLGVGDRLRQRLRLDRPARIHRRLKALPESGLPIPPSLGHITFSGFGSIWLCPLVAGKNLLYWADDGLPGTEQEQLQLLNPVVDAMLDLHRAGFVHGDFKWGNVLYSPQSSTCWLVDVDGVCATGEGFTAGKLRDLARFLLDCSEAGVAEPAISRLLSRYAEGAGQGRETVAGLTAPLMARLRQRHIQRYGEGYRLTRDNLDL